MKGSYSFVRKRTTSGHSGVEPVSFPQMSMTVAQLLTAARELPPQERETLCTQIAETLDMPFSVEEQAWVEVAERRAEGLNSGKVKGISAEEVLAKARRKLNL